VQSKTGAGAKAVSLKEGTVPIIWLDGERIVALMIDQQFGMKRRPMVPYQDKRERLYGESDWGE